MSANRPHAVNAPLAQGSGNLAATLQTVSLRRAEHIVAALLLMVILALFYRDVIFRGRTFLQLGYTAGTMPFSIGGGAYGYPTTGEQLKGGPIDPAAIAWENEPFSRRASELLWQGVLPLWNPSQGMGEPFMANGTAAPFEPIQVIFSVVPSRYWPLAADLQVLLRYFLAGIFTYLFMRKLGLGLLPGVCAGVAFMLSSYFITFGNHHPIRSETLLPLLLYCYERFFTRPFLGNLILTASVITWVLLASFPESGFLVIMMATLWYTYRSISHIWQTHFARQIILARLGGLVLVVSVGLGLAAFSFLPLVEEVGNALHIHEGGTGLLSLPPVAIMLSVLPGALPSLAWLPYFYSSVLALAILGIVTGVHVPVQRQSLIFFSAYAAVFFLKSYDFPALRWIGLLPGLSQINIPRYIVPSLSLCCAILAAYGIQAIIDRRVTLRSMFLIFLGFFAFCTYWLLGSSNPEIDIPKLAVAIIAALGTVLAV
ncbi:MAG: hypothetical protein M3R61_12310, partial [Chloroflexota bacterium]|nr:hypothetical protein [Chloroflexota bacterium]